MAAHSLRTRILDDFSLRRSYCTEAVLVVADVDFVHAEVGDVVLAPSQTMPSEG